MRRFMLLAVGALAVSVAAVPLAQAGGIPALVQFSTTGAGDGVNNGAAGGYDVVAINEFDWQSSGDAVIEDALVAPTTPGLGGGGAGFTSFASWAAAVLAAPQSPLVAGNAIFSSVTFAIHAQARLNDMLDNGGGSVAPASLDRDGAVGGDAGFEITGVLDGIETAVYLGVGVISFTAISGTYTWFVDQTPDSDVDGGTGFTDGTPFLTGTLDNVSGTFTLGTGGSVLIENSVTSYDSAWIQTDPTAQQPLVGTTFDTLVSLRSSGEAAAHDVGDTIGQVPYVVKAADLGFKADANTEFSAVPEPGTMILLGTGLLGVAGYGRRRTRKG